MERKTVKSSNIASVGYDAETKLLEVEFTNGTIYEYNAVPQQIHEELISAKSIGHYFSQAVRGHFQHRKSEEKKWPENESTSK